VVDEATGRGALRFVANVDRPDCVAERLDSLWAAIAASSPPERRLAAWTRVSLRRLGERLG